MQWLHCGEKYCHMFPLKIAVRWPRIKDCTLHNVSKYFVLVTTELFQ